MRCWYSCPICQNIYNNKEEYVFESSFTNEEITKKECPKGHSFIIYNLSDKYRTIFDEAIMQLQDGFYNNAVLNAYTSLEEFMKFYIKFKMYIAGKDIKSIFNFIESISQSENKKGAFMLCYFDDFNSILSKNEFNKFSTLRNKIIHDCKFIEFEEAYKYCENIYIFINKIINRIYKKYSSDDFFNFEYLITKYYNSQIEELDEYKVIGNINILPPIGENGNDNFKEAYETFKIIREITYTNYNNNSVEVIEGEE